MKKCQLTLFFHYSEVAVLEAHKQGESVPAWNHPSKVEFQGKPVNTQDVVEITVDITAVKPRGDEGSFLVCLAGFSEG